MNVKTFFSGATIAVFVALTMTTGSFLPIFAALAVPEAQATTAGFPLYSWGNNANGHLGLGNTTNRSTPTRVGTATNWVMSVTALGGSFAINAEGHLYGWGAAWNTSNMGRGGVQPPAENLSGSNIVIPTRIGTADNWVYVSARSSVVAAINSNGELFTWGTNSNGQLGLGDTSARNVPTQVGSRTDWTSVAVGGGSANNMMLGITEDGQLWSWGSNMFGLLGRGNTGGAIRTSPAEVTGQSDIRQVSAGTRIVTLVTNSGELWTWGCNLNSQLGRGNTLPGIVNSPARRGTDSNWHEVRTTDHSVAALKTDGTLWTWGNNNGQGQLGRGGTGQNGTITQTTARTDWVSIHGGNSHYLAFSEADRLYGWGNNSSGQLGVGGTAHRTTPTLVTDTLGFSGAARGGGLHSIMLMHIEPVEPDEFFLEKRLHKPEGTPEPDLIFTFNMNRKSFDDLTTPAALDNFPNYPTTRTIAINDESSVISAPNAQTTILSGVTDILEGIIFSSVGVYAWTITEEANTSGATLPSYVVYSQAEYEFRVYVRQLPGIAGDLYIYAMTLYRVVDTQGNTLDTALKVNDMSFVNEYTRTTTGTQQDPGALNVRKQITGNFADLSETFTFNLTLTDTVPARPNLSLVGRVLNADNVQVGSDITFASGILSPNITLGHNYRLVFDELTIGTRFEVTEATCPLHIASVVVYSDGEQTTAEGAVPGEPLSTGTHLVGAGRNAANFTNERPFIPPTGLIIESGMSPFVILFASGLAFAAFVAKRKRREIEELPLD